MIQFKIMKKAFKDAITLAKKTISKKDTFIYLIAKGNQLIIFAKGNGMSTYHYVGLTEAVNQEFIIKVEVAPLEKWLDKKDREMVFDIHSSIQKNQKTKTEDEVYSLLCVEKNSTLIVDFLSDSSDKMPDVQSQTSFQYLNNPNYFIEVLKEAGHSYQKTDSSYLGYLHFKGHSIISYDSLLFAAFILKDEIGFLNEFGTTGIALKQSAIDVLVKSINEKEPIQYGFDFMKDLIFFKQGENYFGFQFEKNQSFPTLSAINPVIDKDRYLITLKAEQIKSVIEEIPTNVEKVCFRYAGQDKVRIFTDNPDVPEKYISCYGSFPNAAFSLEPLRNFFEDLEGEIQISHSYFNSNTTAEGYLWKYVIDGRKSKIMPGRFEAPGFKAVAV